RVDVAANCLKLLVVKRGPVRIACDGPLDEVVREEATLICTRRQTVPLLRLSHGSHSAYAALQEPFGEACGRRWTGLLLPDLETTSCQPVKRVNGAVLAGNTGVNH